MDARVLHVRRDRSIDVVPQVRRARRCWRVLALVLDRVAHERNEVAEAAFGKACVLAARVDVVELVRAALVVKDGLRGRRVHWAELLRVSAVEKHDRAEPVEDESFFLEDDLVESLALESCSCCD